MIKGIKKASFLATSLIVLSACHQQKTEKVVNDNSSTHIKSEKVIEEKKEITPEEQYAPVIEDFRLLLEQGVVESDKLNVPLDSWTIEGISKFSKGIRYAFYDLNADGLKELLVSNESVDGGRHLLALYHLKDNTPVLLGETYYAFQGGARNTVTLYQNGSILIDSWDSGTGNGVASNYQLEDNTGHVEEVSSKTYQAKSYQLSDLGLLEGTELDLSGFDWHDLGLPGESALSNPKMDIQALANGDFSSLEGRWRKQNGDILEFDSSGVAADSQATVTISHDGFLSGNLFGIVIYYVPSGVVMPPAGMGEAGMAYDASDSSKDRILLTQYAGGIREADQFYYRVE